ncbi:unnamed protein product [Amoebophrya sp. A25]|nr:unnamed protein product [Amoebophrya sp. A25]|eukprot:GSA25T00008807001.1
MKNSTEYPSPSAKVTPQDPFGGGSSSSTFGGNAMSIGVPVVGAPVAGAPHPFQAQASQLHDNFQQQRSASAMFFVQPLVWDRPRVFNECSTDCWMGCACPCAPVEAISKSVGLPNAQTYTTAIAVFVFLRWVFDMLRAISDVFIGSTGLFLLFAVLTMLMQSVLTVILIRWKSIIGQKINVGTDSDPMEDFVCFWCCPCHHIPAVERTVVLFLARNSPNNFQQFNPGSPAGAPTMMMSTSAIGVSSSSSTTTRGTQDSTPSTNNMGTSMTSMTPMTAQPQNNFGSPHVTEGGDKMITSGEVRA